MWTHMWSPSRLPRPKLWVFSLCIGNNNSTDGTLLQVAKQKRWKRKLMLNWMSSRRSLQTSSNLVLSNSWQWGGYIGTFSRPWTKFNSLAWCDVAKAHPRINEAVETMLKKSKWIIILSFVPSSHRCGVYFAHFVCSLYFPFCHNKYKFQHYNSSLIQ